jgi:hypothetical protein
MEYTPQIAKHNIQAMLRMYVAKYPELSRKEAFDLMCKQESHFLGLNLTAEEMKSLNRKKSIRKGTFFKKRKKGKR